MYYIGQFLKDTEHNSDNLKNCFVNFELDTLVLTVDRWRLDNALDALGDHGHNIQSLAMIANPYALIPRHQLERLIKLRSLNSIIISETYGDMLYMLVRQEAHKPWDRDCIVEEVKPGGEESIGLVQRQNHLRTRLHSLIPGLTC